MEERQQDIQKNIGHDGLRFLLAWFISRFLLAPVFWFYTRILNHTEIIGKENLEEIKGKSFLLCPNHTCSWDIWAGWEVGFLAVDSFFSMQTYLCGLGAVERLGSKPIRTFCLCAGVLPVDRSKGIDQYALQDLDRLFSEGNKIIGAMVYPEGTRSLTGRLSRNFKSGVGWLQARSGVPVIPMYHMGYDRLPGFGRKLKIIIGKPVYFEHAPGKADDPSTWIAVSKRIMDEIRKLEDEYNPAPEQAACDSGFIDFNPRNWLEPLGNLGRSLVFAREGKKVGLIPDARGLKSLMYAERASISAVLPPTTPSALGSGDFRKAHGVDFAYCVAPFETGVCSPELVGSMARAGFAAFCPMDYLELGEIEEAIARIRQIAGGRPFGMGMKYHRYSPDLGEHRIELLLATGVPMLYISHYVQVDKALVHYRVAGLREDGRGGLVPAHRVFVRVPHAGLAERFAAPPEKAILDELVREGRITAEEARLASRLPFSQDIVVEGDLTRSGGKAEFVSLLPAVRRALDAGFAGRNGRIRLGAGGGISTPESVHAAFALGADFVVTGSFNALCAESGASGAIRRLLARSGPEDFASVATYEFLDSDLRVMVSKFGTMFASRAGRFENILRSAGGFSERPELSNADLDFLEDRIFRKSLAKAWEEARPVAARWWPELLKRVEASAGDLPRPGDRGAGPGGKLAVDGGRLSLLLRWYLYSSSRWALDETEDRKMDFQVRADPSVGAFNRWISGSCLDVPGGPGAVQVALNLLYGAAVLSRTKVLGESGIPIPAGAFSWKPRELGHRGLQTKG